ncbi:general secretion pathway protein GspB [Vibrio sp. SCSIO 43136]|uniref:general secretion pathway protein GspB n=1 Tax=Vibrio sp. SCSIO 43136 TaxID=2819101 RepID=UPI0020761943|nr:general secretion pathway protein GspB [Vibrio sp. SCSIO 43136]USD64913.1 general secretion pathway protein GspB [Vibrio sp. SCSIO 43136]
MNKLSCIAIALLPPLAVAGVLSWQHMAHQPQSVEPQVHYRHLATVSSLDLAPLAPLTVTKKLSLQRVTAVAANAAPKMQTQSEMLPQESSSAEQSFDLDDLDLSELSPELASRVESLMAQPEPPVLPTTQSQAQSGEVIALLDNLDKYQGRLPAMNLQTHMYVSSEANRWVKVNDKEVHQGQWITPLVQLTTITPRSVVVKFEGQEIEIPALYEWK